MIDISVIFDKLKPMFAVNAAIEMFGALFVVFAIVMARGMRLEKGLMHYVLLACIFTIVNAVGDAIAALFRGMPGETARWAVVLGNFFGAGGSMLCAIFYAEILFYTYKDVDIKTYKIFRSIITVLVVMMLTMLIVSQFTGWLYTIDENNVYRRGSLFFVSVIYTILCILCAVIYMVIRRKQSKKRILHHHDQ